MLKFYLFQSYTVQNIILVPIVKFTAMKISKTFIRVTLKRAQNTVRVVLWANFVIYVGFFFPFWNWLICSSLITFVLFKLTYAKLYLVCITAHVYHLMDWITRVTVYMVTVGSTAKFVMSLFAFGFLNFFGWKQLKFIFKLPINCCEKHQINYLHQQR